MFQDSFFLSFPFCWDNFLLEQTVLIFLHLKMSQFLLYSWKIFSLDIRFWVDNFSFFFSIWKMLCCLLLASMFSDEKSWVIWIVFSPKGKVSFLLHCFQDFCSVCSFRSLTMICLDVDLFGLTMFRIDSDLALCLSADLRNIQSFFSLKNFFLTLLARQFY